MNGLVLTYLPACLPACKVTGCLEGRHATGVGAGENLRVRQAGR
jgi:hypothetical protein